MSGPLRVVLDTNVLLSLFVFADSRYAPILGALEDGAWLALTTPACLDEYARVLGYPEFRLDAPRQADAYARYCALAAVPAAPAADAAAALPRCKDRDDQKFLELARDGGAHCLVTSDKALLKLARRERLKGRFAIITPGGALALLAS